MPRAQAVSDRTVRNQIEILVHEREIVSACMQILDWRYISETPMDAATLAKFADEKGLKLEEIKAKLKAVARAAKPAKDSLR